MAGLSRRPVARQALAVVPAATLVGGALLSALPLPLGAGALPNLPLLLLIAWAAVVPRLLPPWVLVPVGLVQDAVAGLPLGVMALVLPVVRLAIAAGEDRMTMRGFPEGWAAAAALVMLGAAVEALALLLAGRALAPVSLLLQAALTILLYPAVLGFVAGLIRRLTDG